ncbi:hypothetical protein CEXT_761201 [Caerostris extrusa]|uniref:Uncharacterized protein n=1 Tax=Caerostris extrusa TaxID=172846 RepID=A0AAV4Q1Y9_CAEEX|nr:hypothetical protein CEXT_761201 [Caerostris extrusa]
MSVESLLVNDFLVGKRGNSHYFNKRPIMQVPLRPPRAVGPSQQRRRQAGRISGEVDAPVTFHLVRTSLYDDAIMNLNPAHEIAPISKTLKGGH